MGLAHNPKIITDGLVLYLDAANPKSIKKRSSNLLSWDSWTIGSGSVTGYTINGTVDENRRILDTNPFGHSDVVWDTPSNDVGSNDDGGWGGSIYIDIDPTKTYRFSTWVRRKVIGNGSFYLGCYGFDSVGANVGVLYRSNGTVDTNPYFSATSWWGSATTWYLVVGHVWPVGSGTGAMHVDSAIYNTSGTKVATTQDYVWQSTSVKTTHRSYLYYSTDPTTNQQWYHPRVDLCNGSEPTISELLNNIENTWYDLSSSSNHGILTNGPKHTSANNGSLIFDGIDDYISINQNLTTPLTICGFVKYTDQAKSSNTFINSNPHQVLDISLNRLGSGEIHVYIGNGSTWQGQPGIISSQNMIVNQWYQITFTSDRTGSILYLNELNVGSSIYSPIGWGSNYYLGTIIISSGEYLKGNIGNIKLYNRVLSTDEIKQNFNATKSRYGL